MHIEVWCWYECAVVGVQIQNGASSHKEKHSNGTRTSVNALSARTSNSSRRHLLSCMHVAFTSVILGATICLEANNFAAHEADRGVVRNSLATRAHQVCFLFEVEAVENQGQRSDTINGWIVKNDAAMKLQGCM